MLTLRAKKANGSHCIFKQNIDPTRCENLFVKLTNSHHIDTESHM